VVLGVGKEDVLVISMVSGVGMWTERVKMDVNIGGRNDWQRKWRRYVAENAKKSAYLWT
jgi:hypothetical protein